MSINRVTKSVFNELRDWDGDNRCYCGLLAAVERKEIGGQCVYRCPKGICDPESCGFVLRLPLDDKNDIARHHHHKIEGFEEAVNPGTVRKVFNTNRLDEGRTNAEISADSLSEEVTLAVEHYPQNQGLGQNSVELCTLQESIVDDDDNRVVVLQDRVSKKTSNFSLNAPPKRLREPIDDMTIIFSESTNYKIRTKFCLRCDGKGHWAKECQLVGEEATVLQPAPEEQKEVGSFVGKSNEGKCFHCQGEGHWAKNCPVKRRKQDDGPASSFSGVCHHCGQPGHWARDCKVKQFQKQAGLLTTPHGLCYKCNKPGHWSKECPMHNKYDAVPPGPSNIVKQYSHQSLSQRGGGGFGEPIW